MALRQVPEALAGFKLALSIDSKLGTALLNEARVYRDTGDLEAARKLLLTILHFHPRMQKAYVTLGHVLLVLERYSEAQRIYAQLFRMERGHGWNGAPFIAGSCEIAHNSPPVSASSFFFKNLVGHIDYLVERGNHIPASLNWPGFIGK